MRPERIEVMLASDQRRAHPPGLRARLMAARMAGRMPVSELSRREGIGRSTLADRVGRCAALLRPLVAALGRHVLSGGVLHADDTPVPVLAPGLGRTRTARLWSCVRDERPRFGPVSPAVLYRCSPDQKAEHPRDHLAGFRGTLQADGYAGFDGLYENGRVVEAACWAHMRRQIHDLHLTGTARHWGDPADRPALRHRARHHRLPSR